MGSTGGVCADCFECGDDVPVAIWDDEALEGKIKPMCEECIDRTPERLIKRNDERNVGFTIEMEPGWPDGPRFNIVAANPDNEDDIEEARGMIRQFQAAVRLLDGLYDESENNVLTREL